MIFTYYTSAKDFSDDVLETLKRHEIQNNLLFHNINDLPNKVMASVKDELGNIILTAIRTIPFPMVMYETDNIRNDEAVAFFTRSIVERGITVDFIMTEKALAKSFCEQYGKQINKSFYKNESLVLYVTDKANVPHGINGSFRAAQKSDMYYLPYWLADFTVACDLGGYSLNHGIKKAENDINNGNLYIWEDEHPVSCAANVRKVGNCRIIGEVYTPPQFRGKGYSTACVGHLTKKLLDDGFDCCALYADCANTYANKVYKKIGYKEAFWYDQYKLEE